MSQDSKYIHKSHNVTVLLYHIVSSAKYRRLVINSEVEKVICETCEAIELRYEIKFLEVGTDKDHVHFLVQTVPDYSVSKVVTPPPVLQVEIPKKDGSIRQLGIPTISDRVKPISF